MERAPFPAKRRFGIWLAVVMATLFAGLLPAAAQAPALSESATPEPVQTESPRDTIDTFRRLTLRLEQTLLDYVAAPDLAGQARLVLLSDQFITLLDPGAVSEAARRETGGGAATAS